MLLEDEGGDNHLGGVADLGVVDVHGGADPLGQIQLRCLLLFPRRRGFTAGKQLPFQNHRLVLDHLTRIFSVSEQPRHVTHSKLKEKRWKAGTLATTTSEEAALDKFPGQFCSLLGTLSHQPKSPACLPTESTKTETPLVSAPSRFQATQV